MSKPSIYYVYIFFRLNGIPYYVGKGKGGRWKDHVKNSSNPHFRNIFRNAGSNLPVVILREGLTESDAYTTEKVLISAIGRKCLGTGPLVNLTAGGEGGAAIGRKVSAETRAKIGAKNSIALRGKSRGPFSIEHRTKISTALKGTKRSTKTLAKLSASHLGNTISNETRAKISTALIGRSPSAEHRTKLSNALLGKRHSVERRIKNSIGHLGQVPWNKGKKLS